MIVLVMHKAFFFNKMKSARAHFPSKIPKCEVVSLPSLGIRRSDFKIAYPSKVVTETSPPTVL